MNKEFHIYPAWYEITFPLREIAVERSKISLKENFKSTAFRGLTSERLTVKFSF